MVNSQKLEISEKTFSSEKSIETNNIFAIRGKKLFLFQLCACKQDTICVTKYMQLNKFLTVHIKPFSNLDRK